MPNLCPDERAYCEDRRILVLMFLTVRHFLSRISLEVELTSELEQIFERLQLRRH